MGFFLAAGAFVRAGLLHGWLTRPMSLTILSGHHRGGGGGGGTRRNVKRQTGRDSVNLSYVHLSVKIRLRRKVYLAS